MRLSSAAAAALLVGFVHPALTAQAPAVRPIASGTVITDAIRNGAAHEFTVEARVGEAIDVTATQKGVDVVLVILDPKGTTLQEIDSPNGTEGDEKTMVLADTAGTYRIALRSLEPTGAGDYALRVQVREANQRDRDRAETEAVIRATPNPWAEMTEREAVTVVANLKRVLPKALALGDPNLAREVAARLYLLDAAAAFTMLDIPVMPGPVPVYYSRGREDRAIAVRDALVKAIDYFDGALKFRPRVSLAVLARPDWERVTGTMYGMPFSVPTRSPLIMLPADHVMFAEMFEKMVKEDGPAGPLARAAAAGSSQEDLIRRFGDTTLVHELGHLLVKQYGVVWPNRWFGEFLANFVSAAYNGEVPDDPALSTFGRAFEARQRALPVTHRSLDDLERLYTQVGPDNYGWYQAQIAARARDVYAAHGLGLLPKMKAAFPVGSPASLPVPEVLSKLDAIAPGFTAWARALEQPQP